MAGAAAAHQAAAASLTGSGQQRAGRTRRTSTDPQRALRGATAAASAPPAALDSLSRLQQLADASPQVAQLGRLQALADARFAPVAQLAGGPDEEELIQGKFGTSQFADGPEEELLQGKFGKAQLQPQLQLQLQHAPRANNTGLPDQLKSGIESLSGLSMDHVRVHYNSSQPSQLNALAYAQGSDIHLAPGQEQHLPHETWHVVQQAQGRVRPTLQMKEGVTVNDDPGLEREADVMGAQAAEALLDAPAMERVTSAAPPTGAVVQRTIRIGTTLYTTDYARYFRRELMITLAQLDFPEKGTGPMWKRVDDWLYDGKEHAFADFRTLIANLYEQSLIEKRMSAGAAMGPRELGNRPAFTTGVKKLLELSKGESQARRHVISSSTLGRAIEMVPAKLETLNAWLLRHEMPAQPSTSSGMLDVRAAKIRIWEHVHNHLGNLWVGPSMPNSAIGFIRSPILRAVEFAQKHMAEKDSDTVPLDSLIELLPKSPWRNEPFAETWNFFRATLIDQLRAYADSGDQVEGVAAVALMVEWIRNADLDLPSAMLDEGYFNRLSSIYGRLVYPTEELFAAKGALDDFLGLGPKASPSASSKKDS
jgi:hypothetical protein